MKYLKFKIIVFCIIMNLSCSNKQKMEKLNNVYINDIASDTISPIFYSFYNDSLFLKYNNPILSKKLKLNYYDNYAIAWNDSIQLKIKLKNQRVSIFSQNKNFTPKSLDLTLLNIKNKNVKKITGIWRCTNFDYEEGESFIVFSEETDDFDAYYFYKDNLDELIIYGGFNLNEENNKIKGKIIEQNKNVYFNFYFPSKSIGVYDYVSKNEFQLISKNYYSRKKYYLHYTRVKENDLPDKMKNLLPDFQYSKKMKDPRKHGQ